MAFWEYLNFTIISLLLFFQIEEEMTLLTSLKIIEDSTSLDSPIHQLNSPIHQSSPQLQLTPVQQSSNNTQSSASTSSFNSSIIQTSPNLSNGDKENNNPAKVCCENLWLITNSSDVFTNLLPLWIDFSLSSWKRKQISYWSKTGFVAQFAKS